MLEAGAAVVRVAVFQNAEPGFLHQVIDEIATAEQIDEIADEAELILVDQLVQQGYVFLAKAACDPLRVSSQGVGQCLVALKHTRCIRTGRPQLRMNQEKI